MIAALSFGFWSGLFGGQYEELWRQDLRHAFPGAKERKDLSTRLEALRRFRNRVAHHDSILNQPVAQRYEQMIEVVGFIDGDASSWVADSSGVLSLLDQRPGA